MFARVNKVIIRRAENKDQVSIYNLCKELNSSINKTSFCQSFLLTLNNNDAVIFVSTVNDKVLGFIEGYLLCSLQTPNHVLIRSLFVDSNSRKMGIGKALIHKLENWAIMKDAELVIVQSRVERQDAGLFYKDRSYHKFKVQNVYKKQLIPIEANIAKQ